MKDINVKAVLLSLLVVTVSFGIVKYWEYKDLPKVQLARPDGTSIGAGPTPNIVACGTNPSIAGNDLYGTITVGTGVITSCQISFTVPLTSQPHCQISTSLILAIGKSDDVNGLTVTSLASLSGGKISYLCPY